MAKRRKSLLFPVAFSVRALADNLQCSRSRIMRAVRAGELPLHVLGPRCKRITTLDVIRWIKSHKREFAHLRTGASHGREEKDS